MKTLQVGIASYDEMKARSLAIAKGKYKPASHEPKIWFTSAESFARILSDRNRLLLRIIAESTPESMTELAKLTGRQNPISPELLGLWSDTVSFNCGLALGTS